MPYEWVPPEMLLVHNDVAIYHCYDDGYQSFYWYTINEDDCDIDSPHCSEQSSMFDVRDLPKAPGLSADRHDDHPPIIRNAIDIGAITPEGIRNV